MTDAPTTEPATARMRDRAGFRGGSASRVAVLASLALALGSLTVAACGRHLPPRATAIDAERGHVALDELEHGRSLLVAKCGSRCHKSPLPSDKTVAEWPKALDEMSERANIDAKQRRAIEQYLVTMAPR